MTDYMYNVSAITLWSRIAAAVDLLCVQIANSVQMVGRI